MNKEENASMNHRRGEKENRKEGMDKEETRSLNRLFSYLIAFLCLPVFIYLFIQSLPYVYRR